MEIHSICLCMLVVRSIKKLIDRFGFENYEVNKGNFNSNFHTSNTKLIKIKLQ